MRVAAVQGAYGAAYSAAVLKPFSAATAIEVATATGNDALDVVAIDAATLERQCGSGELRELPPGLTNAAGGATPDFLDGGLQRCGAATFAWSSLFVADPAKFTKRQLRTIKDVFNTRAFPGKRALPRNARGVLEAALMADGVAPASVYERLATEAGMQQALAEISAIGGDIVWYDKPDEAIALIRSGKAAVALTSNTRAFLDAARRGPLDLIWDGQVYDVEYLAIPAKTANAGEAEKLIAFATSTDQLVAVARQIPYGPMRRSAVERSRKHSVTGEDLTGYLPTEPANMATALRFNSAWWAANSERVAAAVAAAWQMRPKSEPTKPADSKPARKR